MWNNESAATFPRVKLAIVIATSLAALVAPSVAAAVPPAFLSVGHQSRHLTATFSAPRADSVTIYVAAEQLEDLVVVAVDVRQANRNSNQVVAEAHQARLVALVAGTALQLPRTRELAERHFSRATYSEHDRLATAALENCVRR